MSAPSRGFRSPTARSYTRLLCCLTFVALSPGLCRGSALNAAPALSGQVANWKLGTSQLVAYFMGLDRTKTVVLGRVSADGILSGRLPNAQDVKPFLYTFQTNPEWGGTCRAEFGRGRPVFRLATLDYFYTQNAAGRASMRLLPYTQQADAVEVLTPMYADRSVQVEGRQVCSDQSGSDTAFRIYHLKLVKGWNLVTVRSVAGHRPQRFFADDYQSVVYTNAARFPGRWLAITP